MNYSLGLRRPPAVLRLYLHHNLLLSTFNVRSRSVFSGRVGYDLISSGKAPDIDGIRTGIATANSEN